MALLKEKEDTRVGLKWRRSEKHLKSKFRKLEEEDKVKQRENDLTLTKCRQC